LFTQHAVRHAAAADADGSAEGQSIGRGSSPAPAGVARGVKRTQLCRVGGSGLGIKLPHHPWERNRFADVLEAAEPGERALHAEAEAAVGDGAKSTQVQVPLVVGRVEAIFVNAG